MNTISSGMVEHETAADRLESVERALGSPALKTNGVLIHEGDCVRLMESLGPAVFDLTVTSPPYNIGKEYERPMEVERYVEWCATWIRSIYLATREKGAFWLNLGYLRLPWRADAIPIPYLIWEKVPFHLVQEIVWNYGAGVACRRSFSPRNEKFLWYVKDPED